MLLNLSNNSEKAFSLKKLDVRGLLIVTLPIVIQG